MVFPEHLDGNDDGLRETQHVLEGLAGQKVLLKVGSCPRHNVPLPKGNKPYDVCQVPNDLTWGEVAQQEHPQEPVYQAQIRPQT